MHHVHISGFALFLIALFVLAFVSIVLSFIVSMWRPQRPYGAGVFATAPPVQPVPPSGAAAAGGGFVHPAYVAPVMAGSGSDLLTGVLVGEALAGGFRGHDTVIVDRGGYYGGPAYDGGIDISDGPGRDFGGGGIDFDV